MWRHPTAEDFDHARDLRKHESRPARDRRLAVAGLISECEALVASGHLTEQAETSLRFRIAHALAAFDMPSKAERNGAKL